jgi:hypothetical protein
VKGRRQSSAWPSHGGSARRRWGYLRRGRGRAQTTARRLRRVQRHSRGDRQAHYPGQAAIRAPPLGAEGPRACRDP